MSGICSSGSNLTFESCWGFPPDLRCASLAHAHWNIHHCFTRRPSPVAGSGQGPQRSAEACMACRDRSAQPVRHRSPRHNRSHAVPRIGGSASGAPATPYLHSPTATDRACHSKARSSEAAALLARKVASERITFRTTFRETPRSRHIALIGWPCTKYARRIFAIVSTTSIPISAPMKNGSQCGPSVPGSRLDADHPENGVLIPCRNT